MKDSIRLSEAQLRSAVQRITSAQQMMRAANAALSCDDTATLIQLGFSAEHIADLKRLNTCGAVGFPDYVFENNERTLRTLERKIAALGAKKTRGPVRGLERSMAYGMSPTRP